MNKFEESENKGRQLFKSFLDQIGATGQPTEDTYDRVDYYFQLKDGRKAVAEIKVRYSYYPDYMIEWDKLKALLQKRKEQGLDVAYYVCFYDTSMYIFQMETIKSYGTVTQKYCKCTTVEDNGYRWKKVVLVPTDKAIRYDLLDGKWHRV